ncbi:MAG: hypothetical protein D6732_12895 [Methanobacteriota archaeon]|nr:MAG: hypothetical protein D6732_12895 [Euryarchaeota archaeon]
MSKIKDWLFGKDKKSTKNKEAEAIALLKKRLNKYEIESRNLQSKAEEQKELAKKMLASGNKAGARQALMRSNLYMQKYNNTQNLMLNLHTQIETISSAKETVETVKALKVGSDVVETSLGEISEMDADRVMIELEEQRDRLSVLNEALSDVSGLEMELEGEFADNIDDQLAALELEMEASKHGTLPEAGATPVTSSEPKKETEEGEGSELEDELEALKKELEGK